MTGEEHLINIDEELCQKRKLCIIKELAQMEDEQDMIMGFMM
jgi:hypothetical protein